MTLSELRDMACRQQAQIDSQHQLLAAKEQRLRYLKEQEARQQRVQAESERLRRLRDRVDAQELKLRKLRALRGQVDHQKQNNVSLSKSTLRNSYCKQTLYNSKSGFTIYTFPLIIDWPKYAGAINIDLFIN